MFQVNIAVQVRDRNRVPIPGAAVTWRVKHAGTVKTLGPVTTQGFDDRPVHIEFASELDEPYVEITATFHGSAGKTERIRSDTHDHTITLDDVVLPSPHPGPEPNPPLGAGWYALIGFGGLVAAAIVGVYLINNLEKITSHGVGLEAYYILLLVVGICVAIFLFGVLRSTARLTGSNFGYAVDIGGPAVIAVLVVVGGFRLTRSTSDEFVLTIFLRSNQPASEIANDATVVVDLEGRRDRLPVSTDGEVTIKGIPSRLRNAEIPIGLESKLFRIKDPQPSYHIPNSGVIYIDVVPISR